VNWIQIQRRCKRRLPLALPLSTSLQTVRGDLGWRSAIQHLAVAFTPVDGQRQGSERRATALPE